MNLGEGLSFADAAIATNRNAYERVTISHDSLTALIKEYNDMLFDIGMFKLENRSKIAFTDMDDALSSFRKGLDFYMNSYDALIKFSKNGTNQTLEEYLNNSKKGDETVDPVVREMKQKIYRLVQQNTKSLKPRVLFYLSNAATHANGKNYHFILRLYPDAPVQKC